MEYKDTVMMPKTTKKKRKELFPHGHKDCFECEKFIKEAQAEISFKAACQYMLELFAPYIRAVGEHRHKAGIKEVVEWLQVHPYYKRMFGESPFEWQAKLKEWGI